MIGARWIRLAAEARPGQIERLVRDARLVPGLIKSGQVASWLSSLPTSERICPVPSSWEISAQQESA